MHGKGVFALQDLAEGETLMEYVGEVISWPEALRRHPHDPAQPNHTFYFHVDDGHVIDAQVGGNASRWINHSCQPSCQTEVSDENGGRVFIKALRNIAAGEELSYDYGLTIDAKYTPKLLADYPCWCGAGNCRGTLLAPKPKKKPGKKKSTEKALKKADKKSRRQSAKPDGKPSKKQKKRKKA